MPPSIKIGQDGLIDGVSGQSRDDLVIGVVASGVDTAHVVGPWQWIFIPPADSLAVAKHLQTNRPLFTPDVPGTYLLYVTVSGTNASFTTDFGERVTTQGGAGVKLGNGRRIPGVGETTQFDPVSGWAATMTSMYKEDIILQSEGVTVSDGPFISLNFEDGFPISVSITESGTGSATVTLSGVDIVAIDIQETLVDASTIAVDAVTSHNFQLELTGASGTLANPTSAEEGDLFNFAIRQNHAGIWPLSFDTAYNFPGAAPAITTGSGNEDWVSCYVREVSGGTASVMLCEAIQYVREPLDLPRILSANLVMQLRADLSSLVTFAGAGGDGQDVLTWLDQSGNGNHFTQSVSADQPSWQESIQNGLGALLFDSGNTEYMENTSPFFSGTSPAEIFYVFETTDSSGTNTGISRFGSHSSNPHYTFTDDNIYDGFGSTVRKSYGTGGATTRTWHVYSVLSESGRYQAYHNGTSIYSNASNTNGWNSVFRLGLSDSQYWGGYMGEVVIYDGTLTDADRATLVAHFNTKWNLGL